MNNFWNKIGDGMNEFIARTLEAVGEKIIQAKGETAPATAQHQRSILREAAHIIRANRHLLTPKEKS